MDPKLLNELMAQAAGGDDIGLVRSLPLLAANETVPPSVRARARLMHVRLARKKLSHFSTFIKPDYRVNWHHHVMCRYLDEFAKGTIKRLMFFMPPRHGKSQLISRHFPSYMLGRNPNTNIIACSYTASLASAMNRDVQRIMDDEPYHKLFPDTQLSGKNIRTTALGNWLRNSDAFEVVGKRGIYYCAGVGGGITGRGFDRGLIDDPVKSRAEAESETMREGVWDWYLNDFYTRRMNDEAGICITLTRWHCLLPGSPILTDMGIKQIDAITSTDRVITSAGVQQVRAAASKPYCGPTVGIRTYAHPETLECTPEHRVLTASGWKKAGDLTVSDWLVFPIPKGETTKAELLAKWPERPLPQAASREHRSGEVTGERGRVPQKELASLLDAGKSYQEIANHFGLQSRQAVYGYVRAYQLHPPAAKVVHPEIVLDRDFWRVVGYWLAEGTITGGRKGRADVVRFTFGGKEARYAKDVQRVMSRHNVAVQVRKLPSAIDVRFSARQVAQFLLNFGRLATGKRLPEWVVLLPPAFLRELLVGYARGDGCVSSGYVRCGSASQEMLHGFQRALLRLGVVASLMVGHEPGEAKGKSFARKRSWELRFRQCDAAWAFGRGKEAPPLRCQAKIDGGRMLVKIKSLSVSHYEGPVYDIETPCHDFLCNLVTVHNCSDLAGKLLKQAAENPRLPQWTVVRFPAVCEDEDRHPDDPRQPGEALWPELFDTKALEETRLASSVYVWLSVHQQRPSPRGGTIFTQTNFRYFRMERRAVTDRDGITQDVLFLVLEIVTDDARVIRQYPAHLCRWFQVVDTAMTVGENAAYTVVGTFVLTPDRDLLVQDIFREQIEVPKQYGTIVAQRRKPPCRIILQAMENKGSGIGLIQKGIADGNPFRPLMPWGDKETRAATASQLYEDGKVWHHAGQPWLPVFEQELTTFPASEHSDQVDVVAYAAQLTVEDTILSKPFEGDLTLYPDAGTHRSALEADDRIVTVGGQEVVFEDDQDQWWSR